MGKMKDLLGDMDFEEFGAKRELVLNKVKELQNVNEFMELSCDDTTTFYDYWLEIGGRHIANERVRSYYGGVITSIEEVDEYTGYLLKRFIDWLESF